MYQQLVNSTIKPINGYFIAAVNVSDQFKDGFWPRCPAAVHNTNTALVIVFITDV